MQSKDYFSGLIDDKTLRVISVFLDAPNELFHINKVSKEAKVPLATTFRIINLLYKEKIIEKKTIGKFSIYRFAANKKTRHLKRSIR